MSHRDPLVAGTQPIKLPDELLPKPTKKPKAAAVVKAGGATTTATAAPTTMSPILCEVRKLSAAAQEAAFPNSGANVAVAASDRPGVVYLNNSALAIIGILKSKGGLPDGIKSPKDVADKLVDGIKALDTTGMFAGVETSGPGFINLRLSTTWLSSRVHQFVLYGALPPPADKKRVIVDFSSPNVAKEMHVGHLRSTIIGDCLCRVLEFMGHDVDRVNHVGDWGTQFGMLIAHLKDVFPDFASKPPPIKDLQQFYKNAKKVFDNDPAFKERAHEEVVRLQSGDGPSRYAWQQICDVSRREFEKVYSRLGVVLHEKGESYYNEYIPAVIHHCDELGLVTLKENVKQGDDQPEDEDGEVSAAPVVEKRGSAKVIFPPKSKHEHPLIVQKSDGGFGYDSTDVTAVWYRLLDCKADWLIYVTDAGQGPHFDLVFDTARAAGWDKINPAGAARLYHTPFGLVQRINHSVTAAFGEDAGAAFKDDAAKAKLIEKLEKDLNGLGLKASDKKMVTDKKQISVNSTGSIEVSDVGNAENSAACIAYLQELKAPGVNGKCTAVEPIDKIEKYTTRSGETVRLVDLLDEAVSRMERSFAEEEEEAAAKGIESKGKLEVHERAAAAKVLGYAAVKYADLKGNRVSNYVFSYDRMLDKKGNTAVYLLYASARITSILRRAKEELGIEVDALIASGETVNLVHDTELALGKAILRFQEVVEQSLTTLTPSTLCEYLYELCTLNSKFYLNCHIIGEPEQNQRLLLLAALEATLRKGYSLIGIGYLEKI